MPAVRRRIRLVLEGRKVEVQTNAMDMVQAERDGEGAFQMGLRTMHAACMRLRVEGVPANFGVFCEQLDEFDDLDDGGDAGVELDPTRRTG